MSTFLSCISLERSFHDDPTAGGLAASSAVELEWRFDLPFPFIVAIAVESGIADVCAKLVPMLWAPESDNYDNNVIPTEIVLVAISRSTSRRRLECGLAVLRACLMHIYKDADIVQVADAIIGSRVGDFYARHILDRGTVPQKNIFGICCFLKHGYFPNKSLEDMLLPPPSHAHVSVTASDNDAEWIDTLRRFPESYAFFFTKAKEVVFDTSGSTTGRANIVRLWELLQRPIPKTPSHCVQASVAAWFGLLRDATRSHAEFAAAMLMGYLQFLMHDDMTAIHVFVSILSKDMGLAHQLVDLRPVEAAKMFCQLPFLRRLACELNLTAGSTSLSLESLLERLRTV